MNTTMQHHHVILVPQQDKKAETHELLLRCAKQVSLMKEQNGPASWCASFDDEKQHYYIDALFISQQALEFHQQNLKEILKQADELLVSPPQVIVKKVFSIAD